MKVKVLRYTSNRNFEQPSIKSECLPARALDRRSSREQHHLPSSRHSKARPCAAYGNRPGNRSNPPASPLREKSTMLQQLRQNKDPRLAAQAALPQLTLPQTWQTPCQMQARARHRAPAAPQGMQRLATQRQTRANQQTPVTQIKYRANPRTVPSLQIRHPAPRQIPFQQH